MNPPLNESWELVHEGQRYKGDLSIETLFGKCTVLTCDINDIPLSSVGKQKKSWVFFCRFALGPKNSRSFISVKESEMKLSADMTAKSLLESSASKINNNELATPTRMSARARKTSENEENEPGTNTPRSSRRSRQPSRYLDDTLPSPLKNAKFSVSTTKTKELCIVIQRCNFSPTKENLPQADEPLKVKARKKLDLEDTPSKTPSKVCWDSGCIQS